MEDWAVNAIYPDGSHEYEECESMDAALHAARDYFHSGATAVDIQVRQPDELASPAARDVIVH